MVIEERQVRGGTLRVLGGGWSEWVPPGGTTATIRLRHRRNEHGHWLITEVHVVDAEGVPAGLLREIPLGALEEVLIAPRELAAGIESLKRGAARALKKLEEERPADVKLLMRIWIGWHYAQVNGLPPAKYVAEQLGISERTVARRVADLRELALLPSARRTRRET